MPADKVAETLANATAVFRDSLTSSYDLDDEVVDAICGLFKDAATPLAEGASKRSRGASKATGDKKPRKKSAYNVYVREQMKTEEIKAVPHKERMGKIADSWKLLDKENKDQYQAFADEENANPATEE